MSVYNQHKNLLGLKPNLAIRPCRFSSNEKKTFLFLFMTFAVYVVISLSIHAGLSDYQKIRLSREIKKQLGVYAQLYNKYEIKLKEITRFRLNISAENFPTPKFFKSDFINLNGLAELKSFDMQIAQTIQKIRREDQYVADQITRYKHWERDSQRQNARRRRDTVGQQQHGYSIGRAFKSLLRF